MEERGRVQRGREGDVERKKKKLKINTSMRFKTIQIDDRER